MSLASRMLVLISTALVGAALVPALPAHGTAQPPTSRTIVVVVEGMRSDEGLMIGGLYDQAATWLGADQAIENCHASIADGRARCLFRATSAARVAFAGMHDENGDGALGRDFIGLPTEGYAFSNDARAPLGPPSFDDASFFSLAAPAIVHMRYGI